MAERGALWGWDLDESPVEPVVEDTGYQVDRYGGDARDDAHDPNTEPIPLVHDGYPAAPEDPLPEGGYDEPMQADPADLASSARVPVQDDTWDDPPVTSYARPFIERPAGTPIGTLTFKPARNPWYRTKAALIALLAAVAAALLLAIVPLVLRGDSAGPEESTGVAPAPSSSVAPSSTPPSPTDGRPSLSSAPAPALPPPPATPPPAPPSPPPAPAPAQDSAPAYTPYYPPQNPSPPQPNKPDIGVTRAPISVAPEMRGPVDNPATRNRNGDNSGW